MEPSEFGEWGKEYNFGSAKSFCDLLHIQIEVRCSKAGVVGERKRSKSFVLAWKNSGLPPPPEIWMNKAEKGTPSLYTLLCLQAQFHNCSRQVKSAI